VRCVFKENMDQNETPKPIDYRAILEAMEAQYAALGRAIAEMRVVAGVSGPLHIGERNGFEQAASVLAPGDVPAGAFHGKSIPDAAILYLRLVKQKQKTADIADALKKGGVESKAKPGKFNGLVHSLLDRASQREAGELVKVQGAYWALREWFSAAVRASMTSGSAAANKKKKRNKKRPAQATPKPNGKVPAGVAAQPTPEPSKHRAPQPDSTEGKILATMRTNPTRLWTPQEVADLAGIPRVQTAVFLMGKLAHREFLRKRDDGLYTFV
jgi:hypothetical protein